MTEGAERAYFRAIEETFIRLRGSPLLLSPEDWRLAEEWRRRGVPLDLVLRTLEQVFARRVERGAAGKIHSLRYCAAAVEAAWEEVEALTATGRRTEVEAVDVAARLAALAASLPDELPERASLAARIAALDGGTDEVERALAVLDEEMMAAAMAAVAAPERERLESRAERALTALEGRMPGDELPEARRRLLRQALRRERRLPVLSLFSPEAVG